MVAAHTSAMIGLKLVSVPQRHETLAYVVSITSSALASSDLGTVRPSALAVLRLIVNSNFVGRTTGSSAGFSSFKICPT